MVDKVAVTPNKHIIIAGADHIRDRPGYIKFWTFRTGEFLRSNKWSHYEMRSLLTTPDSRSVIVSGRDDHTFNDGTYYILMSDIATGKYRIVKQGHDFSINLSFTWDKKYILFGEYIWDWQVNRAPVPKRDTDPTMKSVGQIVLAEHHVLESNDEGFVVRNFQTGDIVKEFRAIHDNETHRYSPMKVTPDGRYLLSQQGNAWSKNSILAMWDLHAGQLVKTFGNCQAPIRSIDITTDGQCAVVLTGGDKPAIKVLDIETGKLILSINPEE
jgi:WD40 repeat protein